VLKSGVRLPAWLHWRVRGQQVGAESATPDGDVVVDLNLEGAEDAVWYLLALGSSVEVLGPPSVREAIAAESARLAARYADVAYPGPRPGPG
jgi:predicted DNA-binding transcriptional regulator YafY